jgi:hypothetical protein
VTADGIGGAPGHIDAPAFISYLLFDFLLQFWKALVISPGQKIQNFYLEFSSSQKTAMDIPLCATSFVFFEKMAI